MLFAGMLRMQLRPPSARNRLFVGATVRVLPKKVTWLLPSWGWGHGPTGGLRLPSWGWGHGPTGGLRRRVEYRHTGRC